MPPTKWTASDSARRFAREAADRLSRQILGNRAPWQRCWDKPTGADLPPFNPFGRSRYHGLNAVKLRSVAIERGYDDPRWMSARSAKAMRCQVRSGEQGISVEYLAYSTPSDPDVEIKSLKDLDCNHETYIVFNAEQIDGLPSLEKQLPRQPEDHLICERAARMIAETGAKIETHEHDFSRYDEKSDSIKMPPSKTFRNLRDCYGHAVLQLTTWTGNKDRAPRACFAGRNTDNEQWSRELMRSSIASMNVNSELRLPYNSMAVQHHERWSRTISRNPDELRWAAEDSHRITKYILERDYPVDRMHPPELSPSAATGVVRMPERTPSQSRTPSTPSSRLELTR